MILNRSEEFEFKSVILLQVQHKSRLRSEKNFSIFVFFVTLYTQAFKKASGRRFDSCLIHMLFSLIDTL